MKSGLKSFRMEKSVFVLEARKPGSRKREES
jgi:hypothetical protein